MRFGVVAGSQIGNCGISCLGRIAEVAGSGVDTHWLQRRYGGGQRGQTFEDLMSVCEEVGLLARAFSAELDELSSTGAHYILHWERKHFVVLERVQRDSVTIFDPDVGRLKLSRKNAEVLYSGSALEVTVTKAFKSLRNDDRFQISSLLTFSASVKRLIVRAIVLTLSVQLYMIITPLLMKMMIDNANPSISSSVISYLAFLFIVLAIFNATANIARDFSVQSVSATLNWDMSRKLFHHMIRLPMIWFSRRRFADVFTRTASLDPIRNLLANRIIPSAIDGILCIGAIVMMFILSPGIAGVAVVGLALASVIKLASTNYMLSLDAQVLQSSIAEQGRRIETLRGIQTIKAMGAERYRESVWQDRLLSLISITRQSAAANSILDACQKLIEAATLLTIIVIGVRAASESALSLGSLYALTMYFSQISGRFLSLVDTVVSWRLLKAHAYRLADVVLTPKEDLRPTQRIGQVEGGITIEGLSYRYSKSDPIILKNCNAEIRPGESVAIVGPSGCGKTTLLKLICGFDTPLAGQIHLDGYNQDSVGRAAFRREFGVVLQEDKLLPGSIAENVSFFAGEVDESWLWECLQKAAIADEISAMPMREHSLVGDMGRFLSGGQQQRLILARALYRRPKVLLLDEATSHLDLRTEQIVNNNIRTLGITRIIVAHRKSTLRHADRLLSLPRGLRDIAPASNVGAKANLATEAD